MLAALLLLTATHTLHSMSAHLIKIMLVILNPTMSAILYLLLTPANVDGIEMRDIANTVLQSAIHTRPVKLPAMSETIIIACVSGATAASPVPTDNVGILVPNPTCNVVVAHSLSEVQNGLTVVRVLNTSENDIELLPGQHLGEFHSTSSNDTTVVEETCCTTSTVYSDSVPPVQIDEANLSHSQAQSLKMLLKKYSTVFSMHSEDRGRTGIIKHCICTGSATPIKQRAYTVTPEQRAEIQKQVDELLKADIIEESYSPWAAPVVLVRKKDGTWRFCLDYRKLNAVTVKDSHPLPRVDDALDALSGCAWFSTMDLQHGYWQVEVEEQDQEKTAFTTGSLPFQSFTNGSD
ncbi:hypothetical protein SRHO_G00176750 [Serrasalmus rhombeus]